MHYNKENFFFKLLTIILFYLNKKQIWDLSDPAGHGYLDKQGFYVALKFVSLAQAGHDINMRNIFQDTSPPKVVCRYEKKNKTY